MIKIQTAKFAKNAEKSLRSSRIPISIGTAHFAVKIFWFFQPLIRIFYKWILEQIYKKTSLVGGFANMFTIRLKQ